MNEKLVIQLHQDDEFKKELEKVNWPIDYGNIMVKLRNGRPTLITIERTVKLD